MVLFHPLPSHVMSRAHHKGVGIGAGSIEPSLPWVQPITAILARLGVHDSNYFQGLSRIYIIGNSIYTANKFYYIIE